jgi:hypothetical protein
MKMPLFKRRFSRETNIEILAGGITNPNYFNAFSTLMAVNHDGVIVNCGWRSVTMGYVNGNLCQAY